VRQIRDATVEELVGEVSSMRSVPRCYKQDKSIIQSLMRLSPSNKYVNTKVEGSTTLGAVTRQRLVKIQQTVKT
jgi:hypothetical protein